MTTTRISSPNGPDGIPFALAEQIRQKLLLDPAARDSVIAGAAGVPASVVYRVRRNLKNRQRKARQRGREAS